MIPTSVYITIGVIVLIIGLIALAIHLAKKQAVADLQAGIADKELEMHKNAEKIQNKPVTSIDDIIDNL